MPHPRLWPPAAPRPRGRRFLSARVSAEGPERHRRARGMRSGSARPAHPAGPAAGAWRETCAPRPPEVSAARAKGGEEPAVRRERGAKICGMKARSVPTGAGLPPQGAQSAAPVSPEKPCCSVQGRFPSPSLPLNLRPVRQAVWQRRTPEHSERRWASPLDCLGCRLFVFNSAAATVRGHRGGQTRPKPPARPPGLPRQGAAPRRPRELPGIVGALSRRHTAGKTFPEPPRHGRDRRLSAPWGGHGAAAGGGGGGPGPPLCSRGRGSRVRRWDEVALLVGKRGKAGVFRAPRPCTEPPTRDSKGAILTSYPNLPASPPVPLKPLAHPAPTSQQAPERRGDNFSRAAGTGVSARESGAGRAYRAAGSGARSRPSAGSAPPPSAHRSGPSRDRDQPGPATPHRHRQLHPSSGIPLPSWVPRKSATESELSGARFRDTASATCTVPVGAAPAGQSPRVPFRDEV